MAPRRGLDHHEGSSTALMSVGKVIKGQRGDLVPEYHGFKCTLGVNEWLKQVSKGSGDEAGALTLMLQSGISIMTSEPEAGLDLTGRTGRR